jgi:hypothetical protein
VCGQGRTIREAAGPWYNVSRIMRSRLEFHQAVSLAVAVTVMAAAGGVAATARQDTDLRAQRIVDFALGKPLPLNVKVGPVGIQRVEFSDRGRVSGGGLTGVVRASVPSEASTTLHARFQAENPSRDEWAVTFTIELLDRSGKVIDRVTKRSTWEGEVKPYEFDHPLLQYAVPLIAQVRITFEAKLD